MKKILPLLLSCVCILNTSYAQNNYTKSDDAARIVISSYVPEQVEGLSDISIQNLSNKLDQITTSAGIGGSYSRFIITPSVNILGKEITPTAPPMTAVSMSITFYIGDGVEGTKFASYSINAKGVGNSETKAYLSAFKNIKVNDPGYAQFLETGKKRIIEYYNSKCDFILKNASSMADRKEYDNAISTLTEVPEVCKECYDKSMDLSVKIFRDKLDNECQVNLTKASAAIAKDQWDEAADYISSYTPDMKCYADVKKLLDKIADHRCEVSLGKAKGAWASRDVEATGTYLSEIPTDSKCYLEAERVGNEVMAWVKEKDGREWKMAQKIQQDEIDLRKEELDVRKKAIAAARDVGIAYAKNQPKRIYNYTVIRGWR